MADGAILVPFCGGSYPYADRDVSPQRSINFYPEQIEDASGRVQMTLRPTEGEEKVPGINALSGPCRGLWWSSTSVDGHSSLYGVFGNKFVRFGRADNGEFTQAVLGEVDDGTTPCCIADNGFVVLVVDGNRMYGTNLTDSDAVAAAKWGVVNLPQLGDDGDSFIKPTFIGYLNQRFVCNNANPHSSARGVFCFTNLITANSGVSTFDDIDELRLHGWVNDDGEVNYYSTEQNADACTALVVNEGRIYLFGERSYEVWAPNENGDGYDPFSFIGGSQAQIGIQAPYSLASIQRSVFFLGGSHGGRNMVFHASGAELPSRISTNAIEAVIAKKRIRSSAYGFCYARDGHIFYVLSFPADGTTLVYDATTKLWHERSSHDWNTGDETPWRLRFASVAFDQQIYFGTDLGEDGQAWLCRLNERKGTDFNGNPLVRKRVSTAIWDTEKRVIVRDFVLDLETGTTPYLNDFKNGNTIADEVESSDANPTAMLRVSRDGGITWKDCPWRKIGRTGQYKKILRWKNLGMGRYIAFELTITEKTPIIIAAVRIAAEACLL